MRTCPACGAPGTEPTCRWCGGACPETSDAPATIDGLSCPACEDGSALTEVAVRGVRIDACSRCAGLWLDEGELARILELSPEWSDGGPTAPRPGASFTYRRCPRCRTVMTRRNHGRTSGVIVDCCPGHGLWLDAGELEAIRRFVRAGGTTEVAPPLPAVSRVARDVEQALPHRTGSFLGDLLHALDLERR